MRYRFIESQTPGCLLRVLCRAMRVSLSAFYAFRRGQTFQKTARQTVFDERVRSCFYFHRRRYGTRRIAVELKIGRAAVRSAMRRENLRAIGPRRFKPRTTNSAHDFGFSPNLLRDPLNEPSGRGQVLVGDITYLPLQNGKWCYLATFQDKFTRRIVGWSV